MAIDDIDDNLVVLKALIADGFPTIKFISAGSGAEGVALCKLEMPDVVLLDIVMPGMDGYEVCNTLKSSQLLQNIPIVIITAAKIDRESRIKALECGADAFLTKPIDESELKAQIRAMLRLKQGEDNKQNEKQRLEELVKQRTEALEKKLEQHKIAEEKIRQSEILYHTLIETSPDGIAMTDLVGTMITANKRVCQIFGYENEEELKSCRKNFVEFVAPFDVARLSENMRFRLSGMESFSNEYMAISKDGKQFPIETKSSVVYDSQNRPYAIIGVVRDITERKIYQDTQKFLLSAGWANLGADFFESLARYLANTLDMHYVSIDRLTEDHLDAQTMAVFFDGNILSNFVYSLKDNPCDIITEKPNCVINHNIRGFFPNNTTLHDIEAECYVGTTLWSSAGKPIGLIGLMSRHSLKNQSMVEAVLHLVSIRAAGELERRDAELALLQSKKAFQNYFQNCSVGMSVTSPEKNWLEVNQSLCQMLGYSKEELGKLSWIDITYHEDIVKNLRLFTAMAEGSLDRYEIDKRFVKKDGTILYVVLSAVCERNPDGSVHHLLASYVDVTARQLAEEAILQERSLLRTLIDNLPDTIYIKDSQCRKIVSNKADLNHMDFGSESEIIGKTDVELFLSDNGLHGYKEDLSVIKTGVPLVNQEKSFLDSKGKRHWKVTSKFPFYDENRKVQGLVGIGYDITERKLIEEALKSSEELYRNLVEKLPDGVYKSTHAGKFISVNTAMVDMLGYDSKEELMVIDIKNELYFEPEDRIRLISVGESEEFDVYKLKKKDGSEIWVEDHSWYNKDEEGNILHHEGILRDVTERMIVEGKLRILSLAVEQSPVSTIITDATGKIEFVNTAFTTLTQYALDEVTNKTPRIFNRSHLPDNVFDSMWTSLLSGKVWKGEFENRRKDQSTYREDVLISSLFNSSGKICNYILIMDDISEKKKMLDDLIIAKEKAEESNRLKSAFLATMNHELRTPLNHILGFSELIMSGVDIEDNISFASSIQSSGQSLLSIIEGIFDLALVEQENIKLRNQTFSLMDHFMENKASFDNILRTSAKHEQIQLIFRPDTRWLSSYVTADRSKINQVLTNLFKNAVKFTHAGTIEFGYKIENESNLTFYVKDTGIGIEKEKQSIIFDYFRQGDDTYTRVYGGIGIGLAISKKITRIMNGELKVISEPDKGSEFSLTIPVELSDRQV